MLCFVIGHCMHQLEVIFESFFLTLFYGKFGKLEMLLGVIHRPSLWMQLSTKWDWTSGLLAPYWDLTPLSYGEFWVLRLQRVCVS